MQTSRTESERAGPYSVHQLSFFLDHIVSPQLTDPGQTSPQWYSRYSICQVDPAQGSGSTVLSLVSRADLKNDLHIIPPTAFTPPSGPIPLDTQLLEPHAHIKSPLLLQECLQRQIALADITRMLWQTGLGEESLV